MSGIETRCPPPPIELQTLSACNVVSNFIGTTLNKNNEHREQAKGKHCGTRMCCVNQLVQAAKEGSLFKQPRRGACSSSQGGERV